MLLLTVLYVLLVSVVAAATEADRFDENNAKHIIDEPTAVQNHRSDLDFSFLKPKNGFSLRSGKPNVEQSQADRNVCNRNTELCPLEKIFLFMIMSIRGDPQGRCQSGFERFGGEAADCDLVFTGEKRSNAIVCTNATVTDSNDGLNYCDIGVPPAAAAFDQILLYQHFFFPASGITKSFTSTNGESLSFRALSGLVKIAFAKNNKDGVVDYVFKSMKEKGCFTRPNPAVHLIGFSFGGILCNMLAVQIAAEYPDVPVRISSGGEPAVLIEPLSGATAALPVWQNTVRYVSGEVSFKGKKGFWQFYDASSEILPGTYYFEDPNNRTDDIIFCDEFDENKQEINNYFADREGCAVNRTDVLNEMARFPYAGKLNQENNKFADKFNNLLRFLGASESSEAFWNVLLSLTDLNALADVFRAGLFHDVYRYLESLNKIYADGNCNIGP